MDITPSYLRPAAVLAGTIGLLQSLIWMGLSVTSIVAYYCNFDFDGVQSTLGSITGLTLFQLYFRGPCEPSNLPAIDFGVFASIDLMRPIDIHAWTWVYLVISFCWFISSCTLLSHVKSKYIRWVNIFLYFWIAITLAVSLVDLALGILFALDYERVMLASNNIPLAGAAASSHLLISAQAAIGTLFSVVLRGYVLWLLNVALVVFLFAQTLLVSDYNRLEPLRQRSATRNDVGQVNEGFESELRRPHPIEAYGNKDTANLWFSPPEPPQAPLHSGHHSRSVFEERKQFYDQLSRSTVPRVAAGSIPPPPPPQQQQQHLQQPQQQISAAVPPVAVLQLNTGDDIQYRQKKVVHELNQRNSQMPAAQSSRFAVPEPDYSPPMPRVNPFDMRRTQQQPPTQIGRTGL